MKNMITKNNDWILIISTLLLCAFGLIMVYSSSYVLAYDKFDNYRYFFDRQLQWLVLSLLMFFFLMFFPYRVYKKLSPLIILLSIFALILVLIPGIGIERNFSQRWIGIGPLTIQPSELVKLGMIIYLAQVYSQKQAYIGDFTRGVMPPLIIVGFVFSLIILQPDLGTATSILLVAGLMVFCSGARMIHLIGLGLVGGSVFTILAISAPYRLERLTSFSDPFDDVYGSGHQLINSYIAIAHGGLSGTGFGQSVQKLLYLPEPHTDFILAVISEELGIFGVLFVFGCLSIIFFRGIVIGTRCKDAFGSLLAFGIVFQLAIQVVFNVGAVSGLLPITGITLPLVSYGGSSLLITMMSIAILANISKYNMIQRAKKTTAENVPL
ncbi:putative lipid II flippase FtsW [Anaerobacillus sp. MEB173]|uniref:putative lipid II flippase FtsW n=1 Tax=Anaerobacillus sp. MEB173 TaxID=3383345 RepID=UPI003F935BA7